MNERKGTTQWNVIAIGTDIIYTPEGTGRSYHWTWMSWDHPCGTPQTSGTIDNKGYKNTYIDKHNICTVCKEYMYTCKHLHMHTCTHFQTAHDHIPIWWAFCPASAAHLGHHHFQILKVKNMEWIGKMIGNSDWRISAHLWTDSRAIITAAASWSKLADIWLRLVAASAQLKMTRCDQQFSFRLE